MDETDTKIDGLRTEMTTLTVRVDHLDRDVNAVIRRMWGEPPAQ
jgi:outer membrane murein-binding lipoprotein Lpp